MPTIAYAPTDDAYKLLGVDPSAPFEVIKSAFKRLAAQVHPDKNPGDPKATERFQRVKAAWDVLRSDASRATYDRLRADFVDQARRMRDAVRSATGPSGGARPSSGPQASRAATAASRESAQQGVDWAAVAAGLVGIAAVFGIGWAIANALSDDAEA